MKKILKILPIVICVCMILTSVMATQNAIDLPNLNRLPGQEANVITETTGSIWKTFVLVAQVLAVGAVVFAGVRYMYAAADRKADIKKSMGMLTLGAIFVFGTTVVIDIVQSVMFDVAPDNIQAEENPGATAGIDISCPSIYEKREDGTYDIRVFMTRGVQQTVSISADMWGEIAGKESELEWKTDNSDIVSVGRMEYDANHNVVMNTTGKEMTITAHREGNALITAEYGGMKVNCEVRVIYNATNVKLTLNGSKVTEISETRRPLETKTITLKLDVDWAPEEITWSTSNSSVAYWDDFTNDYAREIKLPKAGTANITVKCDGMEAMCTINVRNIDIIQTLKFEKMQDLRIRGMMTCKLDYLMDFKEGVTYVVIWDYVIYECVARKATWQLVGDDVEKVILGHQMAVGMSTPAHQPDNSPFMIINDGGKTYIHTNDTDSTTHTLRIYEK